MSWIGRGKGRNLGQPGVPGEGGIGAGGGRAASQPEIPGVGGTGAGGGRSNSQPTIISPSSWVGAGQDGSAIVP